MTNKARGKVVRFYQGLYIPPLARAGNRAAINKRKSMIARGVQLAMPQGNDFRIKSKAEVRAHGIEGGRARAAQMSREDHLAYARNANQAYRALPVARRREIASQAASARWAKMTEEERVAHRVLLLGNLERGQLTKMQRRDPGWPFPHGPSRRLSVAELNERRVRKARLRRFLKMTSKGKK